MSKTLFRFSVVLALLSALSPTKGNCQTNKPLFRAYYLFQHQRDLDHPDQIHQEEMLLSAGTSTTQFVSYDKIRQRLAKYEELQSLMANSADRTPTVSAPPGKIVTPQEITRNTGDERYSTTDFLVQYYTYTEPSPQIDWQIHNDSVKQILDFACTKASATFRGRQWEVWFSTDVPYPEGPWLLTGLPGLIIQAEDTTGQVKYELTALENGETSDPVLAENDAIAEFISAYTKNTEISKDEFFVLKKKALKNPTSFRNAQSSLVMGVQDYGLLNNNSWAQTIPNPVDLTELE